MIKRLVQKGNRTLYSHTIATTAAKQNSQPDPTESTNNRVHLYAREVLTLGLIWLGFNDVIKEGDGDMVIRYWRFLLLTFKRGDSQIISLKLLTCFLSCTNSLQDLLLS